jgi:tetratricopeptide (TPR) repeat protein
MARLHALSGDVPKARAVLEAVRARLPFEAMRPGERPWFELAELSAMLGDAAAARRYLTSGSVDRGRDGYWAYDRAAATAGWIALAEGRPEEAAERFRAAGERGQGNGTPMLWPLGRALEAAGRTEEARVVYRRRAEALFDEQPDLGLALERLASLDAAAGDRAGAEAALRRLATLWTAPESRTRVAALRQQLDALEHAGAALPLARTPRPGGPAKVGA